MDDDVKFVLLNELTCDCHHRVKIFLGEASNCIKMKPRISIFATIGDTIVGSTRCTTDNYDSQLIGTASKFRVKNDDKIKIVMRKLVEKAIEHFKELKCDRVIVSMPQLDPNDEPIIHDMGFEPIYSYWNWDFAKDL